MSLSRTFGLAALASAPVFAPRLALAQDADSTAQTPRAVRASGAQVVTIFPDSLLTRPRTLSELLAARAPGVVMQRSSGAAAAGAWVSFRDAGAAGGLGPLVVVDGVRRVSTEIGATPRTNRFGASTLDDIPVDQVERVELLRGPAAAAAYGSDARNGAIVVTTRAPRVDGDRAFRASLTGGVLRNTTAFPANFAYLDASTGEVCPFYTSCTQLTRWTPLNDYQVFREGGRAALSADAAASLGRARIALGTTLDRTRGVLASDGSDRGAGTLRLDLPFGARSSLALTSQAVFRGLALPREQGSGVTYLGLAGWAKDCTPATPCLSGYVNASHGYATFLSPEDLAADGERQRTRHLSQGLALSTGAGPVALRTTAGVDRYVLRGHDHLAPRRYIFSGSSYIPEVTYLPRPTAERRATRLEAEQQASVEQHAPGLDGATLLALRFEKDQSKAGDTWIGGATSAATNARTYDLRATQQARIADRVDASLGLRWTRFHPWRAARDYPSRVDPWGSLALDAGSVALPGAGATTLRLRAAAGRVSSYDRLWYGYFYLPISTGGVFGPQASMPPEATERSVEIEGGFDLAAAAGATHVAATLFRRADRFEELYFPLSLGVPSTGYGAAPPSPLGRSTRGLELSLDARPVATERLTWRVGGFATFTKDETRTFLGLEQFFAEGPARAPYYVTANGRPLGDWWSSPIRWTDVDGDGRPSAGEVNVVGPPRAAGRSRPSRIAGLTSSLALRDVVTLGATLDYRGGHKVLDLAHALQCQRSQCALLYDASADPKAQAAAMSAAMGGSLDGFLEPGDALRLADVSLTLAPRWLAGVSRGARPTLTVAARDIRLWSRSHALDDETVLPAPGVLAGTVDVPQPLVRSIELRLDLAY